MKKSGLIILISAITLIIFLSISMKYTKHPNWANFIISFLAPLATIYIGLLVYNYTTNNHSRTLLNSLDEKSGWRKSLFELAGQNVITYYDLHKLRATLRFKQHREVDNYFKYMSNIMIDYCDKAIKYKYQKFDIAIPCPPYNKSNKSNKNNKSNKKIGCNIITKYDPEIIRLFSRYLLANHWEKNQLTEKQNKIISNYQKKKFKYPKYFTCFIRPYFISNDLKKINNKELELLEYTLENFITISCNLTR